MPSFQVFDYYFALDVLKISLETVNLQTLYVGWIIVLVPSIYQRFFLYSNYIIMFTISQITYFVAGSINLALATRCNKDLGIPDVVLYFLGGSIAEVLERGFTFFPSIIIVNKCTPPGIESTMYSLSLTVILMNQFIIRSWMGVLVNDYFVFVTKAHMENYPYLKVVAIIAALLPFSYMWYLVPTLKETDDLKKSYQQEREEELELIQLQENGQ